MIFEFIVSLKGTPGKQPVIFVLNVSVVTNDLFQKLNTLTHF